MPQRGKAGGAEWPQLWANVNSPPMAIYQPDQAQQLGSAWRKVDLTPFLQPLPGVPPVSIIPTSAAAPVEGGPGSFAVAMTGPGESGTWTVEKDAGDDWLTIDSPTTPQSADGQVMYTVDVNAGAARSAGIHVNGKTFTVTQAGV